MWFAPANLKQKVMRIGIVVNIFYDGKYAGTIFNGQDESDIELDDSDNIPHCVIRNKVKLELSHTN